MFLREIHLIVTMIVVKGKIKEIKTNVIFKVILNALKIVILKCIKQNCEIFFLCI